MPQTVSRKLRRGSARAIVAAVGLAVLAASPPTPALAQQRAEATTPSAPSELFVFIYRPGPAWRQGAPFGEQGLGPHGAYMKQLFDAGRLFAGGGFADQDGGLAIVTAPSMEEARAILAADPAVTSGIFVGEVEHWRPRFRADRALPRRQ
jgi:uncharacterized protein YciI